MEGLGLSSDIMTAIGTVGFPIVAYFLMFAKFDKTIQKLTEQITNNNKLVALLMQKEGVKEDE